MGFSRFSGLPEQHGTRLRGSVAPECCGSIAELGRKGIFPPNQGLMTMRCHAGWARLERLSGMAPAQEYKKTAFDRGCAAQNNTTLRMLLPACIRSKAVLISARGMVWVIIGSISILPCMYQSTMRGTSVRPRAPPNAVPFHTRPVTNCNGWGAICVAGGATPMTIDWPQPRWHASRACRITVTLPVQSNV